MVTSGPRNYVALLDEAWQAHLAPRAVDAPTVVSTFTGCGGSSLGYSMAGYRELLAVEWDANAVATFRLNFPDVPVYHGNISALSVECVLELTGLRSGELDVLDGSPPCQGFSTAGKRILDDPRNSLFREYVRLLRGLRPTVFVMENVSGMVKGKMRLVFVDILKELKASGYRASVRLMNAKYFSVPQSRQRIIFIGVRNDLAVAPSHPVAATRVVTIREAWAAVVVQQGEGEIGNYAIGKEWARLRPGEKSKRYQSLVRSIWDQPSPTLTRTSGSASAASVTHPDECRKFSSAEAKRIGSFPDDFQFEGKWADTLARIGNSVPPLFMRAIAAHIRTALLPLAVPGVSTS